MRIGGQKEPPFWYREKTAEFDPSKIVIEVDIETTDQGHKEVAYLGGDGPHSPEAIELLKMVAGEQGYGVRMPQTVGTGRTQDERTPLVRQPVRRDNRQRERA